MNPKIKYELQNPFYVVLILVLIMFAVMQLLFGCKTTKDIQIQEKKTDLKQESDVKLEEKKSSETQRTIHTISEGSHTIPQMESNNQTTLDDFLSGNPLAVENNVMAASVIYDSASKSIKIRTQTKPVTIPVKQEQFITESIKTDEAKDSSGISKLSQQTEGKEKAKMVKRTNYGGVIPWIFIAIVLVFGFIFRKRIPILKNLF